MQRYGMRVKAKYSVDLHMHSRRSDGELTPTEIVQRAARRGIRTLAITDHDTVAGLDEAQSAASEHGLNVIPGIEISAWLGREVHILGYFFDADNQALSEKMDRQTAGRIERLRAICQKLDELGLHIDANEVVKDAHGGVGRPHIARAMLKAGHVKSFDEAFRLYLGADGLAYVPASRLEVSEAVELIRNAGGVTSVAHPGPSQLEAKIPLLKEMGVSAIEVAHPAHSNSAQTRFRYLAALHGMAITGGSDLHQRKSPCDIGQLGMTDAEFESLVQIAGKENEVFA